MEDKKKEQSNEFNNKKKHLISFAKINKYFIFPFLCPIFNVLAIYFWRKIESLNDKMMNEYIHFILNDLSYILGGTPYILLYYRQKENKYNDSDANKIKYINKFKPNNKDIKNNSNKKWLIIIILILLAIIQSYLDTIFINNNNNNNLIEQFLYALFFIPLFSKFILKQEIYKHQYLSLIISILCIIFIDIPIFFIFEQNDIIPNIINFIIIICFSLSCVLIKYVFNTFFISPYKLCLLLGIIFIPINLIGYIIYSLIKYNDLSYFKDCFDFSKVENKTIAIIYIIIYILFNSAYTIFIFIVIFYFSPLLYLVSDTIFYFIYYIIDVIEYGKLKNNGIVYPIVFFIMFLSSLVYNEIIILNFCGLNKNTKIFVEHRQIEESLELSQIHKNITLDVLKNNDDDNVSINSDYYLTENN